MDANQQSGLPGIGEAVEIVDPSHAAERALFEQVLEDFAWKDDWLALLEEGWYWRDAAIIAWLALPASERVPGKKSELADLLGMSRRTLYERLTRNGRAVEIRAASYAAQTLLGSVGDVIEALMVSATDPSYKNHPDRKLALEMMGVYSPKQTVALEATATDPAQMTREELERRAGLVAGSEDEDDDGDGD